jgi:serine protease
VVSLIAPDGSPYVLSNRQGGSADNIDQVYTVNLGSEVATGRGACASRTRPAVTPATSISGR